LGVDSNEFFGVNLETRELNVKEYYQWIFDKFSGDRDMIQEFLKTQGSLQKGQFSFMHTSLLDKTLETMKPDERLTHLQNLSLLSERWKSSGIVSQSYSPDDFANNEKLYSAWTNSIPCLKYFEQWGARFWTKYAIEMRGTILFVNPDDQVHESDRFKILSMKLPRGAEAVTGMVLNTGTETQDVKQNKIKILDLEQQDTCTRLCKGQPIDMFLTSKGDGSLLTVTAYTGRSLDIILPIIELFGSNYVKLWARQSMRLSAGKHLLVPATQGTLMESGFMAPYMVTAILCGSRLTDRQTLEDHEKNGMDYCAVWEMYGEQWIEQFLGLSFFDTLSDTHTFSFEAICENRKGLFGDQYHTELACRYETDRLIFLGMTICERRFYVPHFIYTQKCQLPVNWDQPLYWKISHASQVDQMIDDLEMMILAKLSIQDFLIKHTPMNPGFDPLNPEIVDRTVIDYEGWVGMKIASFETTDPDHLVVMSLTNFPLTIYSKIKTMAYYKGHKFHAESIPYLTELAKTAGHIFPLARKIAGICGDGVFAEKLSKVGVETMKLLDFKSPNSDVIKLMEQRVQSDPSIRKSPLIGFFDRSFDVQCKICLKFCASDLGQLLVPVFLEIFPEIDPGIKEFDKTVIRLVMELKPWDNGYSERIRVLNPRSPCIQDLIVACVGTSLC